MRPIHWIILVCMLSAAAISVAHSISQQEPRSTDHDFEVIEGDFRVTRDFRFTLNQGDGTSCGGEIYPGTMRFIPIGCSVAGNVETSTFQDGKWQPYTTDWKINGQLLVVRDNPMWFRTLKGANATNENVQDRILILMRLGCGHGCSNVAIIYQ